MKKLLVLALLGALCLTGCNDDKNGSIEPPHIDDATETQEQEVKMDVQTSEKNETDVEQVTERQMTGDNIENSMYVVDMIASKKENENVMFSPTSLNFALGMLDSGANGYSKDLLSEYLGSSSYGDYAHEYMKAIEKYNSPDEEVNGFKTKLEIANALWVDNDRVLKQTFKELVEEQYKATAETVDFGNPSEACGIINEWSNKKTYGMIPQIIDETSVNTNTDVILTNSVYFESAWLEPWNLAHEDEQFTSSTGDKEMTKYIYGKDGAYFETEKATAFSSRYVSGLEFIGILPKNEGDFVLSELDIVELLDSRSYEHDELWYKMPRLAFDTDANLTDILSSMGLQQLFTDEATIFEITDEPLKVDTIIQKTRLELDENGTKAAAVTAVCMKNSAVMMPKKEPVIREVYLDRPFAFLIYDAEKNEILFVGKVNTAKGE